MIKSRLLMSLLALTLSSIASAHLPLPLGNVQFPPGTDVREELVCQPEFLNGGVQVMVELTVDLLYITSTNSPTETAYYTAKFKENFLPDGSSYVLAPKSSLGNFGQYTIELKKVKQIQTGAFGFGSYVATISSNGRQYIQKLVCD
ncbi:MAG: hypothetical protein ACXVLQ_13250 [Bacteriovorax sp.]